jgi:hypothetical protein
VNEYSKVQNATERAKILVRAMLAAATLAAGDGVLLGDRQRAVHDYHEYRDKLDELLDDQAKAEA